ncbi:PAS domain S-box protein [Telmatocola sphagniphila]|uniref:histidine kinase n=1 Tax=Telmatocola sphagniphila TaxID=1123043 RepID=A0A8E6BBD2_9BACT|nr:PAS domain-containing sensor histidine kinase [Telmatocola sphagniphila]QVL34038.1 PAS domain S-box protein [Telmatocola sphagniphila]
MKNIKPYLKMYSSLTSEIELRQGLVSITDFVKLPKVEVNQLNLISSEESPICVGNLPISPSAKTQVVEELLFYPKIFVSEDFNGLLQTATDAVVIIDRDPHIVCIEPQMQRLFGYSGEELLSPEFELLMPEPFRSRFVRQQIVFFEKSSTRAMSEAWELRRLRKDPIQISFRKRFIENGFIGASLIQDITDQNRVEVDLRMSTGELQEPSQHKDEFLGMLAHELRNPLASIRYAIQVLKQDGLPLSTAEHARDIIDRQTVYMAHLIDDLSDASRIIHGKLHIDKVIVDLCEIVQRSMEICQPQFLSRKQEVAISFQIQPICLLADPTRLIQIFTNLLSNSSKYSDEGDQIRFTATVESGDAVIRVQDHGIGIDVAMLPHIFELFTQGYDAIKRSEGGLGIGLSLVHQLVSLHGGSVVASSEGRGRGSEFLVRLPLAISFDPNMQCSQEGLRGVD